MDVGMGIGISVTGSSELLSFKDEADFRKQKGGQRRHPFTLGLGPCGPITVERGLDFRFSAQHDAKIYNARNYRTAA